MEPREDNQFTTPVALKKKQKRIEKVIPPSPFMQRLGYGTGVSVYLMERSPTATGVARSPWAVKKINSKLKSSSSGLYEDRMKTEASLLSGLNHPNIIGFRGTTRNQAGHLCLCLEKGEKSLHDDIESRLEKGSGAYTVEEINKVAYSLASALEYLHKHRILHGDLKSQNVLLLDGLTSVKLCDFGVAVKLKPDLSDVMDGADYVGTGPWTCMEALIGLPISHKADIYSLGCVLYEMITLTLPHLNELPDESFNSDDDSLADESFSNRFGSTLYIDKDSVDACYGTVIDLIALCTSEDPEQRPSAESLVAALTTVVE